jgi:hypothetical protein
VSVSTIRAAHKGRRHTQNTSVGVYDSCVIWNLESAEGIGMAIEHEATGPAATFLALDDRALLGQCNVDTFCSSGPGGQKRNKTSSGVRLRHHPTGVSVIATEDRSQHVNKARAVRRLREAIALAARTTVDPESYRPSELLASCVTGDGRLVIGRRDARYALVVSELLDVLAGCGMRVSDAARCVGVSTSHLVGFVERDPKLWSCVNRMRTEVGVKPLR